MVHASLYSQVLAIQSQYKFFISYNFHLLSSFYLQLLPSDRAYVALPFKVYYIIFGSPCAYSRKRFAAFIKKKKKSTLLPAFL